MSEEKTPPRQNEEVSTNKYSNKLLEFQKRVSAISKDSVNPFFKSKYFDVNTVIDTIKPVLNEVGIIVLQPLNVENEKNILYTDVVDAENSKVLASSKVLIPEITDIQKFGATLTYFRRYALVSLLLLQGEEDDDGNASSKSKSAISKPFSPKADKVPATMSNGANTGAGELPATAKQKDFIKTLLKANHLAKLSEAGFEERELTIGYAKDIIDKLLKMKDQPETPTIEIDQNGEYV